VKRQASVMNRSRTAFAVVAVGCMAAAGCHKDNGSNSSAGGTTGASTAAGASRITIAGSSALVSLMNEAAQRYMHAHPEVTVQVSAGGSRQGLAQAASGAVDIGSSDVFATGEQAAQLEDHKIAVVGFATMANRGAFNANIESLTRDQLQGIFTGRVHNWSEVGGTDQAITVINRARNSGTRAVYGSIVLGGDNFVEGAAEQDNSGQLATMLQQQQGAVSYLALSYLSPDLKAFSYDGHAPTPENIAAGTYPIWSYEHLYTHGPATGAVRAFIDFVTSPEFQNDVLPRMHFVPIAQMHTSRDHD
jgi:phosphate transport system substrate-binding protein